LRLLAKTANEKGDLFARLIGDLFLVLGYENPRMNIHKTGREIDLKARHRLENKFAIAECKATKAPVGGDDLNKFAGVLQVETAANQTCLEGYFVSLNGFRPTAREQEEEAERARFILLDGQDVQDQLVEGGFVVSPERVCDAAGRLASTHDDIVLASAPELLAHEIGWIWLCQYEKNHERTHFALIHADGRPLGAKLAAKIVNIDRELGGNLFDSTYLDEQSTATGSVEEANNRYREYLCRELGEITLEGLPADEEVGARRIALEDLYVPLEVEPVAQGRSVEINSEVDLSQDEPDVSVQDEDDSKTRSEIDEDREPIGSVLTRHNRMAILAAPGAGKSTLIKRLAVAYATSVSSQGIKDDLPNKSWLPIFIRCRTLGAAARSPLREIIDELPRKGEFPEVAQAFADLTSTALREGKVLLLVDGLDEISSEGDRLAFVRQLRTFLGTYPTVALVLTSRERGFRVVAGAMSSICEWFKLADFDNDDIRQLTRAWHATVVGKSQTIDTEAKALAETIIETDRVRRLARNPLLLTTLLLVKRWVGDLPRKRTVLYEKAIDVLLMTWNVEAHEPIDREEAIPQLAFVAHALTSAGTQSLSSATLTTLLEEARDQMPEVLGFARTSVSQFVERVESRSSLLVMTGHVEENGQVIPNYEFRHLTFQEYLTAVAMVEGYYRGHTEEDRLVERLEPHFSDPAWTEVVALANVRAGRKAREVVDSLVAHVEEGGMRAPSDDPKIEFSLLARALADEVQLTPELVKKSSIALARTGRMSVGVEGQIPDILASRYGDVFREVITDGFFNDDCEDFADFGGAYANLLFYSEENGGLRSDETRAEIMNLLVSDDDHEVVDGALSVMLQAFKARYPRSEALDEEEIWSSLLQWSHTLIRLMEAKRPAIAYACAWALVWLGDLGAVAEEDRAAALKTLLRHWRTSKAVWLQKQAAWAFANMPPAERSELSFEEDPEDLVSFIEQQFKKEDGLEKWRQDRRPAALMLAYYLGEPWDDIELKSRARAFSQARRASYANIDRLAGLSD
jgi:NACHT domain/Restriction endonuclease